MTAKVLLALASTVILGSEYHGPHDLIVLSAEVKVRVKVRVSLNLAAYLQSVLLGATTTDFFFYRSLAVIVLM
jgi:hypothetical protein